jgi:hypothetical protein
LSVSTPILRAAANGSAALCIRCTFTKSARPRDCID